MEEDPFNPDYVEVDRVLEVSYCEDKDTGEVKYIFLLLVCLFLSVVPEHVLLPPISALVFLSVFSPLE